VLKSKTVFHIRAAKPVRMTSKVFCFLIPGVEVQDGISHQAVKPERKATKRSVKQ
jgi:hypothetical protein